MSFAGKGVETVVNANPLFGDARFMQHLSPVFVAHYSLRERFLEQLDLLFLSRLRRLPLPLPISSPQKSGLPRVWLRSTSSSRFQLKTRRVHISIPRPVPKLGLFEMDHKSAA